MPNPPDIQLPPNWTIEFQEEDRMVLQKTDGSGASHGFVSIDWGWRRFDVGFNAHGFVTKKPATHYAGRGWREALLSDALKSLDYSE